MASQTLAEAAKLIQNDLVAGVAEDIIDIDPLFDVMGFDPYTGQAVVVNAENALGDAMILNTIGGTITAKAAATFTQTSFTAGRIIGDVEMDGLVQAQSASAGVDQTSVEISSKSKSVGRTFRQEIAGDGTNGINALHSLIDSSQFVGSLVTGEPISFILLDELMDLVKSKNGQVDWLMMAPRTMRAYKALLRDLGGTPGDWVFTTPLGRSVTTYEGIPIFKNEFLPIVETGDAAAITGGAFSSVWAGVFDDGSRKVGIAGIHPASMPAGISVEPVGPQELKDVEIWRVKWYTNFVNYNIRGLARLPNINN